MGNNWEPPGHQQQGRTGPNGPRYANRQDRNRVRSGNEADVGKPGGCPLMLLMLPVIVPFLLVRHVCRRIVRSTRA